MLANLDTFIDDHRQAVYLLFRRFSSLEKPLLLRSELIETLHNYCERDPGTSLCGSVLERLLESAQHAVVHDNWFYLATRSGAGKWFFIRFHVEQLNYEPIFVDKFLWANERVVESSQPDAPTLEVDFKPFRRGFPRLREARSIGHGVEFLNRHLSNHIFHEINNGGKKLFEFLRMHHLDDQPLMVADTHKNLDDLREALREAEELLASVSPSTPWDELAAPLGRLGFLPGWGRDAARTQETMRLLSDILEAPAPDTVAEFLGRIPMIFKVVVLSPHGFFGQSNVLGKPDTGGQVVYILDQVRALERAMLESIERKGLKVQPSILVVTRLIPEAEGTTCNERIEPISGTKYSRILRIPFRNENGEVLPRWISRFHIWPYLETFAEEAAREIPAELGGQPDFIIGNYSDGNLVASLLCNRLGVTQCNIAHALEKTKYLFSDLYWRQHEESHIFACQYTADLIAMNRADFIIASTFQEIAGTPQAVGQYESYQSFTLPGKYRVCYGIDVRDPKFNIVSPGADPNVFFSHSESERRPDELRDIIADLVHGGPRDDCRGQLDDRDKPLLFAISRLDHVKNPAGFLTWYGGHERLRELANVLVVGGFHDPQESDDEEERDQIEKMHAIIDEYGLEKQVRWVRMQSDKWLVGELYRYVADTRGAFVQPALFEAFGLTVIEAMSSGLPTFATCYGGPAEIIEDGKSGFHIDPNHGDAAADRIADFLTRCRSEPEHWNALSQGALDRVAAKYTWKRYAERLLRLSRVYGFWNYISDVEQQETERYLEMFYHLMYRPMAAEIGLRNRADTPDAAHE